MIGQGKMFVLNWKDTHFNPIVGPKHMLFQYGSMRFQAGRQAKAVAETASLQVGNLLASHQVLEARSAGSEVLEAGSGEQQKASSAKDQELEAGSTRGQEMDARATRDQVLPSPQVAEARAVNQEIKETRNMQEPESKIHDHCKLILAKKEMEIKNLHKQMQHLQSQLEISSNLYDTEDIEELDSEAAFVTKKGFKRTNPQSKAAPSFKCSCCVYTTQSENDLKHHKDSKHPAITNCKVCNVGFKNNSEMESHKKEVHSKRTELNCDECQFQANTVPELKKHLNTRKHRAALGVNESTLGDTLKCKDCKQEFSDFWNLMNHRRDMHPEKRRRCRNEVKGECEFDDKGPNGCWWSHSNKSSNLNTSKHMTNQTCSICKKEFPNKYVLMMHKKEDHEDSVPLCRNLKNGGCDFQKCWFRHKDIIKQTKPKDRNSSEEPESELVFLDSQTKTKPPECKDLKDILTKAMEMINKVNKKMESIPN